RDVKPVEHVGIGVGDWILNGLEPRGKCLIDLRVKCRPRDTILRTLELPILRITSGHVVGAAERIANYNHRITELVKQPAGGAAAGVEPFSAGVAVKRHRRSFVWWIVHTG